MKIILSVILLFTATNVFATEYRVKGGEIEFAKVRVVLNGEPIFFWNIAKGDAFYDQAVLVGTNTVTRNYPTPSVDEVNLSTCGYKWRSWEDFKEGKKGKLKWQIKMLQDDDADTLSNADAQQRIDWLRDYRSRQ